MEFHFANAWHALARALGEAPALRCEGATVSWAAFADRALRLASVFEGAGLGPGAKVGLYLLNCNEYTEAHFGAFSLGACPINVNYRYQADELVYLLENSDAEAVLFHSRFAERIEEIRPRLPGVKLYLQVDDGTEAPPLAGALAYEAALASATATPRAPRPADDVYMLYTGGTTGMPKGVMYENGAFCAAMAAGGFAIRGLEAAESVADLVAKAQALQAAGASPVSVPACPQMHGTGMWIGTIIPLLCGGSVVTKRTAHFDPDDLFRTVDDEGVTDLTIVGDAFARPMVAALDAAEAAGRPYALDRLALISSSGVMWSQEVKAGLHRHKDFMLYDAMGSTEGSMGSSVATRDMPATTARFALGENVKVFTEDDQEVTPGSDEVGLVATAGLVPLGYYKDPEKSARTFRVVGGVRYSFPGDFARVEADGTITLLGRGSQCINTGGEKVYTEEVEEAVKRHDAVADCLVVGLPDERLGNRVVAVYALTNPSAELDDETLRAYVRSQLAGYKVPKAFVAVPQVQRAPNGKADYRWARATAEAAA